MDDDLRSAAGRRQRFDRSAHQFNEALCYGKAEPGALYTAVFDSQFVGTVA